MKRIFTLLWLTLVAFTFNANAQQTSCNAEFSWQFINNNTVKFTPVLNDSPLVHHEWHFGDGTPNSPVVSPTHVYALAGTYVVTHTVVRFGPNGNAVCTGSITHTIIVQGPPCNLVADFSWNATTANPLMIEFHNLSTPSAPTDSVRWIFGDGATLNGVQSNPAVANPVHTYANAGTYNVCLIVKKNDNPPGTNPCIRYICKTVVVHEPCNLIADFNWTVTAGNPLRIEFHNTSTPSAPTDSVRWTFGDGTTVNGVQGDPTVANPVHYYSQPGTYNVCIRVKKNNNTGSSTCVRELCKTIVIPQPCNLVVDFSWTVTQNNPLRIEFHNLSVPLAPADSTIWSFGDGTSSFDVNPVHTYANAGTYTVCLIVKKYPFTTSSQCVRYTCKTVVVTAPCNFQVNFSWQPDQVNPKKIYFTNLTITPNASATATWYFGDGTSASTWNAVHEYAQPGRYYVCLKVEAGPNCIRYKCDSITVHAPLPPCNNQSNFSFLSTAGNSQTFTFIPAFQNSAAVYTWTFGDGTGSHDMIATHHYTQPGIYVACLTVWRSATCASTTCKEVRVVAQLNCDTVHVTYSYQPDTQVPNKIHFYANSNVPILDQTWTIVRMPVSSTSQTITLHQNNPTYLFQDTGYYRVCLRAITLGGCIKEYCSVIHISQVSNACLLQAYPNPATNVVNVNVTLTAPEMINAYVYNSQNVLVKEKHQQGNTGLNVVTLNINDLPAGMYTMRLIYGNHICYALFQKL